MNAVDTIARMKLMFGKLPALCAPVVGFLLMELWTDAIDKHFALSHVQGRNGDARSKEMAIMHF
jgi:hypothetical protein